MAVQRMCLIHFAVRNTQPTLDNGNRIADGPCMEHFVPVLIQLAQGDENVYIRRGCIIRSESGCGNGQVYNDMSRYFEAGAGLVLELDRVPMLDGNQITIRE